MGSLGCGLLVSLVRMNLAAKAAGEGVGEVSGEGVGEVSGKAGVEVDRI